MPKAKLKKVHGTFMTILKKPEMQILPGQIAFYFLMSVIPIAAISAIVASYITKSFDFVDMLHSVMPEVLANIFVSLSQNIEITGMATVLILYIFVGSNAPASIITASNMLYEIKQPRYLKLKIKSFIMTVMIVFLLLFVILIPLLGDTIVRVTIELLNIPALYSYKWIYKISKVLASCLIMYTIIKFLYTFAPDAKIKSKSTTKGTIFTTISWILSTEIFAIYITSVASYDAIYGNFANVLILLIWLYLLAYFFVMGMAINVEAYEKQGKCLNEKKGKETERKENNKEDESEKPRKTN